VLVLFGLVLCLVLCVAELLMPLLFGLVLCELVLVYLQAQNDEQNLLELSVLQVEIGWLVQLFLLLPENFFLHLIELVELVRV